ncbi:hypothetical protein JCM33374_g657 [Metschnikowia sp. JCM 33374]|nr:hypothetical protein JCM33374_g657 [Metschnikowia sp. JCM 33374]
MKIFLPFSLFLLVVSSGYAPHKAECPGGRLTREAKGISPQEAEWVAKRQTITTRNLERFLENSALEHFDPQSFLSDTSSGRAISIGLAFSGGAYRAMLTGAGCFAALDNRTEGAHDNGLGGLVQSATYISGLSGGSWLLGSIVANDFTSIQNILDGKTDIWDLHNSMLEGSSGGMFGVLKYYVQLVADVSAKAAAGFRVTLTDLFARGVSHQIFPKDGGNGAGLTWSDIQTSQVFVDHQMPFPVIVANARTPRSGTVNSDSTIIEMTPLEFGSWDPSLNSFTQTKYLGTSVNNGFPVDGTCVTGFDNVGFMLGASSTIFNVITDKIPGMPFLASVKKDVDRFFKGITKADRFVAAFKPNPFRNVAEARNHDLIGADTLSLVDGGEDLENIPLYPHIQKARGVDIVFAFDSSDDTKNDWPNGTALFETYKRMTMGQGRTMCLPQIPEPETFVGLGLNKKPVFFGCDSSDPKDSNMGETTGHIPPLIVYTANRKVSYDSNKSTFKLSYSDDEKRRMIRNGFEVASRNNGTEDRSWRTCVACAIIRREQERRGVEQTEQCKKCFQEYCWRD